MRKEFGEVIADLVQQDKRVYLLAMDVGYGIFDRLKGENPSHYLNLGITEQATIGIASGMALEGLKPYVFSILPFALERPFEQIKLDIVEQNTDVKIIGFWDYPSAGPTHCTKNPKGLCDILGIKFIKPKNSFDVGGEIASYVVETLPYATDILDPKSNEKLKTTNIQKFFSADKDPLNDGPDKDPFPANDKDNPCMP